MKNSRLSPFTLMLILLMLAAMTLAACGGTEPDSTDTDDTTDTTETDTGEEMEEEDMSEEEDMAGDEAVHLALGNHLTNETWHALFADVLAEYTAENPNITIEQQSTAFGELQTRVAADRITDEPPDMYVLPAWWLGNLVESGIPAPAPDDIAQDIADNFTPGAAEAVVWDGVTYGVPFENNPTLLLYNVPALEAAGYDRPPETLDELVEYARNLTIRDEDGTVTQYGWSQWVGSLNYNYLPFTSLLYSCGGAIFDENGQAAFNSEAGVDILEKQVELIEEGAFNPELTATDWYTGRVAMTILPNWTRSGLVTNNDPENFRAAPVPHCEGHESGAVIYTWLIIVNQASDNQDAAWEFIRWLTQPYSDSEPSRSAQLYYDIASIIPARYHDLEVMEELFSADVLPPYVESVDYAKAPAPYPAYNEIIEIIITEIDNAWFMRKTPQEALDDAAAQADALLQ